MAVKIAQASAWIKDPIDPRRTVRMLILVVCPECKVRLAQAIHFKGDADAVCQRCYNPIPVPPGQ